LGAGVQMKGYIITDGYHEFAACAETRGKATGMFIKAFRFIDWKRLRAKREPSFDGPVSWGWEMADYAEYWGRPVRLPS
jgi:hypothetical protein